MQEDTEQTPVTLAPTQLTGNLGSSRNNFSKYYSMALLSAAPARRGELVFCSVPPGMLLRGTSRHSLVPLSGAPHKAGTKKFLCPHPGCVLCKASQMCPAAHRAVSSLGSFSPSCAVTSLAVTSLLSSVPTLLALPGLLLPNFQFLVDTQKAERRRQAILNV